jgi:hypothetical protein
MTRFTVRTQCPRCENPVQLPLLKGEDAEGRYLTVNDEVLSDHAETCEVTQ